MKLDGESETLVRWMDKVASIIQFFSYWGSKCVGENKKFATQILPLKKEENSSSAVFKICGLKFRHS